MENVIVNVAVSYSEKVALAKEYIYFEKLGALKKNRL